MQANGLTPESAAVVNHMAGSVELHSTEPTIEERRAALHRIAEQYGPPFAPVRSIDDRFIDGSDRPVRVRVYHPVKQSPNTPVMVQFHGGGWALGGPATYERQARAICHAAETVIVDVDYRLAPEHKYPAALEDCEAAARWSLELARSLGLRDDRLVVVGDSAGGYLAALFCQRNPSMVAGQVLIYPVLTVGRTNDLTTRETLGSGEFFLTFDAITNAEQEFFADVGDAGADGPSPLLASQDVLKSLPRTLIILADLDPLVAEGREYACRLNEAGVQVTTLIEEGTIHGFILFSGAIIAGEKYFDAIGRFAQSNSAEQAT